MPAATASNSEVPAKPVPEALDLPGAGGPSAAVLAAYTGSNQALKPVAAVTAADPITAFIGQIQAFVTQIVQTVTQAVTQLVQAVTQAITAVINVFVPTPTPTNSAPIATAPTVGTPDPTTGVVLGQINATDPEGDALTYSGPIGTTKGLVSINAATGAFTYSPTAIARNNAASNSATNTDKADTFSFTVTDSKGASTTIPVNVAISPAAQTTPDPQPTNHAPVAGTPVVGTPDATTGVVTGSVTATDADADTLAYSGSTTTAKGAATVATNGTFTYTPTATARHAASQIGATALVATDNFTVTISDGKGGTATAQVTVAVSPSNAAPVAGTPTVGTPDTTTGVVIGTVIATDANSDTLTYSTATSPTKGSVSINANTGAFTYTPTQTARNNAATAGATAADKADTFTVTVADGYGGTTTVPVNVVVSPSLQQVNRAPVAGTTAIGYPDANTGAITGIVTATDADGDSLTFSGSTTTSKGSVVLAANGSFIYTPTATARHAAAQTGATSAATTDSFTVSVSDGKGGSTTIPVTVSVSPINANPVASAPNVGSPTGATGMVTGTVAATDTDGDALTYSGSTTTSKGTVVVNANGTFTYTPTSTARHLAADPTPTTTAIDRVSVGNAVGIAVSHDGSRLFVSDGETQSLLVFNTATNTLATSIPIGSSGEVVISPDETRVYVTNSNGALVVNPATNTVVGTITGLSSTAGLALSPDGSRAYITDQLAGTVAVFNTANLSLVGTVNYGGSPIGVAVSPDGSRVYVTGYINGNAGMKVINTASNTMGATVTGFVNLSGTPDVVAVSPDGAKAYVGNGSGGVWAVDTATYAVSPRIGTAPANNLLHPNGIAVSPNGRYVFVTSTSGISAIDTSTQQVVANVTDAFYPGRVVLNPTGTRLYATTPVREVVVIDTVANTTDQFTVTVTDGYGGTTAIPVRVAVSATAPSQVGDIRMQADGLSRAMYANNGMWISVNPGNGGQWRTPSEVVSWLDVSPPTGTETNSGGPYSPGAIKIPPGTVAGAVQWFLVKLGPPVSQTYSWMACSTYNACSGVTDAEIASGGGWGGFPYSQWVDLRL